MPSSPNRVKEIEESTKRYSVLENQDNRTSKKIEKHILMRKKEWLSRKAYHHNKKIPQAEGLKKAEVGLKMINVPKERGTLLTLLWTGVGKSPPPPHATTSAGGWNIT